MRVSPPVIYFITGCAFPIRLSHFNCGECRFYFVNSVFSKLRECGYQAPSSSPSSIHSMDTSSLHQLVIFFPFVHLSTTKYDLLRAPCILPLFKTSRGSKPSSTLFDEARPRRDSTTRGMMRPTKETKTKRNATVPNPRRFFLFAFFSWSRSRIHR